MIYNYYGNYKKKNYLLLYVTCLIFCIQNKFDFILPMPVLGFSFTGITYKREKNKFWLQNNKMSNQKHPK